MWENSIFNGYKLNKVKFYEFQNIGCKFAYQFDFKHINLNSVSVCKLLNKISNVVIQKYNENLFKIGG